MNSQFSLPWWRGATRYQWTVLLIAWFGWVFDIMDTALFNFAKGPMLTELLGGEHNYELLGPQTEARILTWFLIGWSAGGLIFGWVADKFGRTRALIWTVLIYAVFTGLTSACKSVDQIVAVRFITAVGIGGEWAAGAALVAEAFPNSARAPAAGLLQSAAAFGPVFAAIANLLVGASDWRILFLIGIFPALIVVLVRKYVKESAAWTEGRISTRDPLAAIISKPKYRYRAIIALLLGVAGIASATNLSFWMPNLVQHIGSNSGLEKDAIQHWKSYVTFAMHGGTLAGVVFVPFLCVRIGRRLALMANFTLGAAVMCIPLWIPLSLGSLLVVMPIAAFFVFGLSAGFVLYFPELFPASLRATGSGLAYNVGRFATAFIPAQSAAAMQWVGVPKGIALTAVALGVSGALVALAAPETKGQELPVD